MWKALYCNVQRECHFTADFIRSLSLNTIYQFSIYFKIMCVCVVLCIEQSNLVLSCLCKAANTQIGLFNQLLRYIHIINQKLQNRSILASNKSNFICCRLCALTILLMEFHKTIILTVFKYINILHIISREREIENK